MIGIYKIINPKGKIYIGQSIEIEKRWNSHKSTSKSNEIKLRRSFDKYGVEFHKFLIIEECNIEDLNRKERYWQEFYNSIKDGLNCKLTGFDNKSGILSEESRLKISNSLKGVKHSEERIEKNRRSNTGKKLSEKSIKKLKKPKGPQEITECPKCFKKGGSHSMKRYHFDNCGKKNPVKKYRCQLCNFYIGGMSNFIRHEKACKTKFKNKL